MRLRYIKRRFPRRNGHKSSPKRRLFLLLLLAAAALGFLAEWVLSGVTPELTEEAARGYLLECVTQAVEAELEADPEPFVAIQREQGGQVALVNADSGRLNRLKAGVLERLSKTLRGRATVHVPVGSLTGIGLLNGRGFPVPLKLQLEGSAVVEFATDFTGAGLNQTCHRLTMTVRARAYSTSRRFETAVETETTTVLAETMVVGEVPQLLSPGGG